MLEVELNTLDPKSFDNIHDFFTKFKSLLLSLGECGIDKSTQDKKTYSNNLGQARTRIRCMSPISILENVFLEQIGKCLRWLSSLSLSHKMKKNSYRWASSRIPNHMHSPCMMEKDHPNRMGRRNKTRRRDIPNTLTILQVPKTLHIPRRRRR
jgi:hypothetical protein